MLAVLALLSELNYSREKTRTAKYSFSVKVGGQELLDKMQCKVSENNRISNGILHPAQSIHACRDYTSDNLTFLESKSWPAGTLRNFNMFYSRFLGKNFACVCLPNIVTT